MGIYVNPANETKESFINREGTIVNENRITFDKTLETVYCVLYDNDEFTALQILYSEREFNNSISNLLNYETRPFIVYSVPRKAIESLGSTYKAIFNETE